MAADTRREKRAPVSLKVRFKSATVDEFIEQYSVDISAGGLFIKTKSPMPIGTLLKFEFQLKDESRLIHGVGRVVWKRDENEAKGSDVPAGMGIKFIKMDAESRSMVDRIVAQRADVQSSFDMVPPAISTTSIPPPGENSSVITIRPAAPVVPDEALRSPIPSSPPAANVPSVAPKAQPRYKSTLAFDAGVLPTPASSSGSTASGKSTLAFDARHLPQSSPSTPPAAPAGDAFFPSTTPESEMPDDADRTNIRPMSELRARAEAAEAAEAEARKSDADIRERIAESRAPVEEEDVGRVTMPESDERRAARGKERAAETEDPKAALRRAAEEEARAERRAAAARHESEVVPKGHGIQTAEPASAKPQGEDDSEAETLPPVASKAAEIAASAAIPAPRAPSGAPELPPLDFDDSDESVTPAVLHTAPVVSEAPEARESIEPRTGKKKKKKGKKGRGGESVRPSEPVKEVRVSTPAAAPAKPAASTAIERVSADRKGPRLAVEDVAPAKKPASGGSKTLPIVLAVVALGAAVGIYFWQSSPASPQPPTPTTVIQDPSVVATPTPSVAETPTPAPTSTPAPTEPTTPTAEVAAATAPVRIESVPAGGTIRFGGTDHGVTPATVDLPAGVATQVTVALQGFAALSQDVTANPGVAPVRFALVPMPYTLIVETVPAGARVTANGRSAVAPGAISLGRVTGPVNVTATKSGYDNATQEVTLNEFVEENGALVRRLTITLTAHVAEAPSNAGSRPRPAANAETPPTPAAANPTPAPAAETPPAAPPAEAHPAETPHEEPPAERPAPAPAPAPAEPLPDNPF